MTKIDQLQLGDKVRIPGYGEFMDGVVSQITDSDVTVLRPYMVSEDFSYTGGVICYTGLETISYQKSSDARLIVLRVGGKLR